MNKCENAKMIKLFLTDVDGCLTDGAMYYTAEGETMKRFCVYDGMGMVCLQQAGIPCGILTSEISPVVKARAEKLKLRYLYLGVGSKVGKSVTRYDFSDSPVTPSTSPSITPELNSGIGFAELPPMTKLEAAQEICDALGITLADVCYVGDDINDIDLLRAVGYPCCPPNARPEVKAITRAAGAYADIRILKTPGGQGAVREITDTILALSDTSASSLAPDPMQSRGNLDGNAGDSRVIHG
jgi:3-deoxy-D-manno-octulosonate 8-phosphate phosphatase KdsC-like HAD superfamily phosphatase